MANLAIAWVLANDNVAGAIVGASRPDQITSNATTSGISLNDEVLKKVDEVLGDLPETDPAKTVSPTSRPA
jgi:aryl-alcohol dehydrogenase-like predicted oxidoreductase